MRNTFALAALLSFVAVGAQAQHSGSYTGRLGNTTTWHSNAANGTITGSITGPRGYTTSGTATAHYLGNGAYGVTSTVTGPRGTAYSHSSIYAPQ